VPYETTQSHGLNYVTNKLGGMCIADQTLVTKGVPPRVTAFTGIAAEDAGGLPADNLSPPALALPTARSAETDRGSRGYGIFWDSAEGREIDGSRTFILMSAGESVSRAWGRRPRSKTTDVLFPSFSAPAPVTPASDSFLAVNISEFPRNPYVQQWSLSVSASWVRHQAGGELYREQGTHL